MLDIASSLYRVLKVTKKEKDNYYTSLKNLRDMNIAQVEIGKLSNALLVMEQKNVSKDNIIATMIKERAVMKKESAAMKKESAAKDNIIVTVKKESAEKDNIIVTVKKESAAVKKALAAKEKENAELRRKLGVN
jgi:hypothetical protein